MKNNKRKTTEGFKEEILSIVDDEYEVLGEYINNKTPILFKHIKCGFEFYMRPLNFINLGNRCPKCSGLLKKSSFDFYTEVKEITKGEYEVLGEYINNKTNISIRHNKCGHIWNANPKWFLKGTRCPICQHRSYKKTTDEFKKEVELISNKEYTLIGEYTNTHTKTLFRHNICGCEYITMPSVFLNGRRCPICSKKFKDSKAVKIIEQFFLTNSINYKKDVTFEGFTSIKNNINYEFDFYIPEINLIIEYDGQQHFKPMRFNRDIKKFNNLQEADTIKNNWCFENNIDILRISYKNEKNILKIFQEIFINESSTTIENYKLFFIQDNKIHNYKEYYNK